MPAFNFKKQFAPKIEDGTKVSTIRADRKDGRQHCKKGDTIALYTGMRTKVCQLLKRVVVTYTVRVTVQEDGFLYRSPDGYTAGQYNKEALDNLAKDEGFACWCDMTSFFKETHGLPFTGTYIRWS